MSVIELSVSQTAVTYATTSAGHPSPIVESATEIRDQVRRVLWVGGLDQVVVVLVLDFLSHGGGLQDQSEVLYIASDSD